MVAVVGNDRRALDVLIERADQDGTVVLGYDELAQGMDVSPSTARRTIRALLDSGSLELIERGKWGEANRYEVRQPRTPGPLSFSFGQVFKPARSGVHRDSGVHSGVQNRQVVVVNVRTTTTTTATAKAKTNYLPNLNGWLMHDDDPVLPGMEHERPEKPDDAHKVDEVWSHFVSVFDPPQKRLSPSRARLIAKALRETESVEVCKQAIDGLKSWRQRKPGDTSLSAIFTTRPNGPALGDQIDFFAAQADTVPDMDPSVPSVHRDRIMRRRIQVAQMLAVPDVEDYKVRGEEALAWLKEHADEEPVIAGGRVTRWRKVGSE
jgi:DNA-binding transcriptional ArsR family regulator